MSKLTIAENKCYHCGNDCDSSGLVSDDKNFCCDGCKVVYEILSENNLCNYYNINEKPGISLKDSTSSKFDFLDDESVKNKLINFTDGTITSVTFYIPKIHCSSCIWLLENLFKLHKGIINSRVNFLKKEVYIDFNENVIPLKELAGLLAGIGYKPQINLDDLENKRKKNPDSKKAIFKIGVAGFCFGNIMMLSFPEYFAAHDLENEFKALFGYFNLALSLPVLFYSSSEFFISAYNGLKQKFINIDLPIALGLVVMFLRSGYEILSGTGAGFMDSLAGLVFFMLLGRYFQNKTYDILSFERDYKSYFPIAVTVINNGKESTKSISDLKCGNRILIRNNELIPADSILLRGNANIDYSFVTGESNLVEKTLGEIIYGGGKQSGNAIELEIIKEVSQSNLTRLWNDKAFNKKNDYRFSSLINKISKYFTIIIITIAVIAGLILLQSSSAKALHAFTSVLIIACPCALALSTPFTLGNMIRIFGKRYFYLKNAGVIEKLQNIDTIVFDKTGTITQSGTSAIEFYGDNLSFSELQMVKTMVRQSSHPLSKIIYEHLGGIGILEIKNFRETPGKGIEGIIDDRTIKLGSQKLVNQNEITQTSSETRVWLSIDNIDKGYYKISNKYREGLNELITKLQDYDLAVISGDNESEKEKLKKIFPKKSELHFSQSPTDKLNYIKKLQRQGKKVLMIGDGLNDSGALKQSDVGISVSDDVNNFSPACDAILDAGSFSKLPQFIKLSKAARKIILASFGISFLYNFVGLFFAVQGILSPVVAAILMPLSSITVVLFTTIMSNLVVKRL